MLMSRSRVAVVAILRLVGDLVDFVVGAVQSRAQLSAENLFLRKQLALYVERQVKPRRADDARRIIMVALSWLSGSRTTIAGVPTRASDPAFRMRPTSRRCRLVIGFATATASSPRRFSAVFITTIGSNHELREPLNGQRDYFAHDRALLRAWSAWT